MDDALVVLDGHEGDTALVREAGAYAAGADADVVFYAPLSEDEYEEAVTALDRLEQREHRDYSDEEALGVARNRAREAAEEALPDFDVEWSVVTDVTDEVEAPRVIEIAEAHDCDHVYALGEARSPTGKAVFGDTTQRLILNFPGYVTVKMD